MKDRRRAADACRMLAVILILLWAVIMAGLTLSARSDDSRMKKLQGKDTMTEMLPLLYRENPDLAGWIRIPGTTVSYPVMRSEEYLMTDFRKRRSRSGTPFLKSSWKSGDRVSMIYGHNMWAEKTMFHPLQQYEDRTFREEHPDAEFFVLCEAGEKTRVERRLYTIHAAALVSVRDDLYIMAENCGRRGSEGADDLYEAASASGIYETDVEKSGDELVLCTCSYHIPGDRNAGRLLIFAARQTGER